VRAGEVKLEVVVLPPDELDVVRHAVAAQPHVTGADVAGKGGEEQRLPDQPGWHASHAHRGARTPSLRGNDERGPRLEIEYAHALARKDDAGHAVQHEPSAVGRAKAARRKA
jgi:hypothetical protein